MAQIRRLHWGCGRVTPAGWINSDIQRGPGINISCIFFEGLSPDDDSIDNVSGQRLKVYEILVALRELRQVLKLGCVLCLCLPELDKAIAVYQGSVGLFLVLGMGFESGNFQAELGSATAVTSIVLRSTSP